MKIVQIAAATAALSVVEAHPSSAKCHATKAYAVGVKIMQDSVTIGANPNPLQPQVTAPMMGGHMTLDPVKLTFKSATTADLYWFAQADKGSLAAPTGANCKAVDGCTDTVYCSPGAADTTDLTWTPPADSKTGETSKVCVFWGTTGSEVTGECATMIYSGDMSGGMCAAYTGETKTACEAVLEKCKTDAACIQQEMAKLMPGMCAAYTGETKTACEAALEKCKTDAACIQQEMAKLMPTGPMPTGPMPTGLCGDAPAGKQYKNGQTATSVGTSETCFENKQTVEEGSSGATATIAVVGMMAAIAAF